MSLTATTIFLFGLLTPGVIFRYAIYFNSSVKRPFSAGNPLAGSVILVFYSLFIHAIASIFAIVFFSYVNEGSYNVGVIEKSGAIFLYENNVKRSVIEFFSKHYLSIVFYCFYTVFISLVIAFIFRRLAYKNSSIGRVLFGPLAPQVSGPDFDFFTCFVLTKIQNDERLVAYAGYVEEVSLKDGSKIDHIVINDPEKFFVKLTGNFPKTTYSQSKAISNNFSSSGIMYISGSEIENVHFEGWAFVR